jgi:hypothetical protein
MRASSVDVTIHKWRASEGEGFVKIEDRHLGGHALRVRLRMFGPMSIEQAGSVLELPASRKVCGLLAYLAVSRRRKPRRQRDERADDEREG